MAFLTRRRSFTPSLPLTIASTTPPSTSFPPAVENISTAQAFTAISSSGKQSGPSLLIRRVSSLFSNRKKRPSNVTPLTDVKHDSGSSQRWQISSDIQSVDERESIDDIRRPSGLGRTLSFSSNRSLPPSPFTAIDEESPFHVAISGFERARSLSSPNLLHSLTGKTKPSRRSLNLHRIDRDHPSLFTKIPVELLVPILSFLPRRIAARTARTCHSLCAAARIVLYSTLDLRTFSPRQLERLISLLAFRRDLTDTVRTFECHAWPSFFPPRAGTSGVQAASFSPTLTATFTVAFQNMHQLTTLVLPSFDETFLRHHSAFGLRKIVLLCTSMSAVETVELFSWLDGQTNITHLAFPNLVEQDNIPPISKGADTPDAKIMHPTVNRDSRALNVDTTFLSAHEMITSNSPISPFPFVPSPTTPVSPFNSSTLLPALTTLDATPSIVTSLMSSGFSFSRRPLTHVILNINTTLYAGLRPGALMTSLQGVTTLKLKFRSGADRRTQGKLLSAAGAGLTGDGVKDRGRQGLHVLQIEIPDSDDDADQALYKTINSVLSRYQGLLSLQLRFTPDQTASHLDRSTSTMELDEAMVTLWIKHCPSLQSITLLSGAIWNNGTWIA